MLNLLNMDNLHFVFFISLSSQWIYCSFFLFLIVIDLSFFFFILHTVRSAFVSGYIQGDIQLCVYACIYMYIYMYNIKKRR